MLASHATSPLSPTAMVSFFPHNPSVEPAFIVDVHILKTMNLLKIKEEIEKRLGEERANICRIYYKKDSCMISLVEDACLVKMWNFFETVEKMMIFFEYEKVFIMNKLKEYGYTDIKLCFGREHSYLYKAISKGDDVIIKLAFGVSYKDVKKETVKVALLEQNRKIISSHRIIDFRDAFNESQYFYTGYEMKFYPRGSMSNLIGKLSEISYLISITKMASIIQFLQYREHVQTDLKLDNFLIQSKITTTGKHEIYEPILIDLEYVTSLNSIIFDGGSVISIPLDEVDEVKSETKELEFAKNIKCFGECILNLANYSKDKEWKYSKELLGFIEGFIESSTTFIQEKEKTKSDDLNVSNQETKLKLPNIRMILKKFTFMLFRLQPELIDHFFDNSLTIDNQFMKELITINPIALKFASKGLLTSEFVQKFLQNNHDNLQYLPIELKGEEEFMKRFVESNGLSLKYAGENLRRDRIFVKLATKQNPNAIIHVTEIFDGFEEIFKSCVTNNSCLADFVFTNSDTSPLTPEPKFDIMMFSTNLNQ